MPNPHPPIAASTSQEGIKNHKKLTDIASEYARDQIHQQNRDASPDWPSIREADVPTPTPIFHDEKHIKVSSESSSDRFTVRGDSL